MNMQSWPDHVLNLVNSTANIIAIIAAALVLISVALIYFTGTELTGRAKQRSRPPVQDQTKSSRLSHTEIELAAARRSEEGKSVRLSQVAAELAATQRSDEENALRLSQVGADLAAARLSEETKALRLSEIDAELAAARRSEEMKALLFSKAEAELATARRSVEEAKALVKLMEEKQHPRRMTTEQRSQFLNAVHGLPKGKVIVSAIFNNKETHDLGAEILSLLKEAGFNVIEAAPLDFFTTSRPSSGIRIGYQNTTNSPSHVLTVRKGFSAIGWDLPITNLVNAHEEDVVEIQVTPKE
jgi:hypothetical protein